MNKKLVVFVFLIVPFIAFAAQEDKPSVVSSTLDSFETRETVEVKSEEPSKRALHAIGVFTGFLDEEMHSEKDHRGMAMLVSLGFDARPLFSKIGIRTKGRLDLIVEPFINTIFRPDSNFEVGSNFLFEYAFPLTDWLQPYIKGGVGIVYMTQDLEEQATQFNFLPQGSAGLHWYFKENVAFSCEYRHRHLSNASIKTPNRGIDAKLYLGGITYFFD